MIYTVEKANLITKKFKKFRDGNDYLVAGQFANIDFWIEETIAALKAIDEHKIRFERMCTAQEIWVEEYNVRIPNHCIICEGICELMQGHDRKPELPIQYAKSDKTESRKELTESAYHFLTRCYRLGLLTFDALKLKCDSIGTSIDPYDLEE